MLARSLIKRMASEERKTLLNGAFFTGVATGGFAYF
jgi:hypothetical protein